MQTPMLTTIEDTQRILSIPRSRVYSLLANGQLDAIKMGRRRMIVTASITRLASGPQALAA